MIDMIFRAIGVVAFGAMMGAMASVLLMWGMQ